MKIYIAGKITGNNKAAEQFEKAEVKLRLEGHETINPFEIGNQCLPALTHEEYMHISFALIDVADAAYFLSNWRESPGACMEYGYTIAKRKAVYFEEEA